MLSETGKYGNGFFFVRAPIPFPQLHGGGGGGIDPVTSSRTTPD